MQSLHHQNNRAFLFIIKTTGEGVIEPAVYRISPACIHCLRRAYRVIYNKEVSALSHCASAHGSSKTKPPLSGLEFMFLILVACENDIGENFLIPWGGN